MWPKHFKKYRIERLEKGKQVKIVGEENFSRRKILEEMNTKFNYRNVVYKKDSLPISLLRINLC